MATIIQNKFNGILGDGARSAKYAITGFTCPTDNVTEEFALLIKTAQFPGKSHDIVDFKFKGRTIPIPGQTKFDNTWTCTFYLEESHKLRNSLMKWMDGLDIHSYSDTHSKMKISNLMNIKQFGFSTTITIAQVNFDNNGQDTFAYQLYNAFPKTINTIELDYSDIGKVIEYTIEFYYSHFEVIEYDQISGNLIDGLKNKFMEGINGMVGTLKSKVTGMLTGALTSAKNAFMTKNESNNVAGDSSITASISSGMSSISSGVSDIWKSGKSKFNEMDFNINKFIDK